MKVHGKGVRSMPSPKIEFEVGGKKWFLTADTKCWILQREVIVNSGPHKGKVSTAVEGYYSSLRAAINSVLEHKLRNSEVKTLTDLQELIKKSTDELKGMYETQEVV